MCDGPQPGSAAQLLLKATEGGRRDDIEHLVVQVEAAFLIDNHGASRLDEFDEVVGSSINSCWIFGSRHRVPTARSGTRIRSKSSRLWGVSAFAEAVVCLGAMSSLTSAMLAPPFFAVA
jgi:hypothetical protein